MRQLPLGSDEFMHATTEIQDEAKNSGDFHPTEEEIEELRTNVTMTRANLKEAKRLDTLSEPLSIEEQKLVFQLKSGVLALENLHAKQKYEFAHRLCC